MSKNSFLSNKWRHLLPLAVLLAVQCLPVAAQQTLATFEDGAADALSLNASSYTASLFKTVPGVFANPDKTGLNTSDKCFGAVNVANADWYGNYVELQLTTPVKITESNRYLSFLAYRSIQPKEMRIGFNGHDESSSIYQDKTDYDSRWERIVIDLGAAHLNETLSSLWIIFSCNWYAPRTGWAEAAYYFDDFKLSPINNLSSGVVIDPSETYQTMDGFGASDCWMGDIVGRYWNDTQKSIISQRLFSQEFDALGNPRGIGLSIWRVNLGGGTRNLGTASGLSDSTRWTDCFLKSDGSYDWTKQSGQQYFMSKAKDYGCENFVFFSNTPPVYFTKNGKGFANSGESGCNLKDDKYDDFAEFMATVVDHFNTSGYNIQYISPINEPQFNWTADQEGSPWQNANIAQLAKALNTSLQKRSSSTKILLPEAGHWSDLYSGSSRATQQIRNFFSPSSSNYLGNLPSVEHTVAGHSYWTYSTNATIKSVRRSLWDEAKTYNLKTVQTEWSLLDDAPSTDTGYPASYDLASYMDNALFMAKLIQSDIIYGGVSSWSYWTALSPEVYSQKNRFFLIRLIPGDGNGGYNDYASVFNSGKIGENLSNLWALGNFSMFVRPGYRRIRMDGANEMNQLLGTSYISPDGKRLVSIYVNTASASRSVQVNFSGMGDLTPGKIYKYVTNASTNLRRDQSVLVKYSGAPLSIPGRSIVTVAYDLTPTVVESIHQSYDALSLASNIVNRGESIHLLCADAASSGLISASLYTVDGRILSSYRLAAAADCPLALPAAAQRGVYLLVARAAGQTFRTKVIVK
jgi:O-glycosyl hydrolase